MIQVVELPLLRLLSEIHTDISKELSTSLVSRECTLDNLSTPVSRLPSRLEIFFQSAQCQRELLSQTVRPKSEIEVHSPEPQEPQLLSLVTPMMERRLE